MVSMPFIYDANLLCLDLVNTRMVSDGEPVDLLEDFEALVEWLEGADLVTDGEARALLATWTGTDWAEEAFRDALRLRDAVKDIADRILAGESVDDDAVAPINEVLARTPGVEWVVRHSGGFRRELRPADPGPGWALARVADSAAELLAELDWSRIERCDGPACVLYFYDTTRNRSRRWCSMDRCGNRAKVSRYRERGRS